jgi:hypothetical protein
MLLPAALFILLSILSPLLYLITFFHLFRYHYDLLRSIDTFRIRYLFLNSLIFFPIWFAMSYWLLQYHADDMSRGMSWLLLSSYPLLAHAALFTPKIVRICAGSQPYHILLLMANFLVIPVCYYMVCDIFILLLLSGLSCLLMGMALLLLFFSSGALRQLMPPSCYILPFSIYSIVFLEISNDFLLYSPFLILYFIASLLDLLWCFYVLRQCRDSVSLQRQSICWPWTFKLLDFIGARRFLPPLHDLFPVDEEGSASENPSFRSSSSLESSLLYHSITNTATTSTTSELDKQELNCSLTISTRPLDHQPLSGTSLIHNRLMAYASPSPIRTIMPSSILDRILQLVSEWILLLTPPQEDGQQIPPRQQVSFFQQRRARASQRHYQAYLQNTDFSNQTYSVDDALLAPWD